MASWMASMWQPMFPRLPYASLQVLFSGIGYGLWLVSYYTTGSHGRDCVTMWDVGGSAEEPRLIRVELIIVVHAVACDKYCISGSESAGERIWWDRSMRASGGSSKVDCQLSDFPGTVSSHQNISSDVFRQTWRFWEQVDPPLYGLTSHRSAGHQHRVSLPTCVSNWMSAMCISV